MPSVTLAPNLFTIRHGVAGFETHLYAQFPFVACFVPKHDVLFHVHVRCLFRACRAATMIDTP